MELSNVQNILNLVQSNSIGNLIEHEQRYLYKKLSRIKIGGLNEFDFVKKAIQQDLLLVNPNYAVSDWISLLIYNPGDYFGVHKDGYSYSSDKYDTVLSGGYLLNDDYLGGEFLIEGKKTQHNVGELFTFSRFVEHEITPVRSGTRYSLHFAINKLKSRILI